MTETSGSKIPDLCAFTYHSRAVSPFKTSELTDLVAAAQARNKALGITGVLGYDEGNFFQHIEGPLWSMEAVVGSIMRDPRHTDIQIAFQGLVPARMYSDWDLRLYRREGTRKHRKQENTAQRAAGAALAGNADTLNDIVGGALAGGMSAGHAVRTIIEPAARQIGSYWYDDECSNFETTLALVALRTASLHLNQRDCSPAPDGQASIVLVTSCPGTTNEVLGVGLTADAFARAGWTVEVRFPQDLVELEDMVQRVRPDVIDIGLSEALRDWHELEIVRQSVRVARSTNGRNQTIISVGGRLFAERFFTAACVNADVTRTSAATIAAEASRFLEARGNLQSIEAGRRQGPSAHGPHLGGDVPALPLPVHRN